MLKITEVEPSSRPVILQLEGQLVGPWVIEARTACERLLKEGRMLQLDMRGVDFMDPVGVAVLANLGSRGVSLVGCSPFIEQQLKTEGNGEMSN